MSDFPSDGRTPGIAMILELVVGRILKNAPDRDEILSLAQGLIQRFDTDMNSAVNAGDTDKFLYLSALVGGAQDTLSTLRELSER